MKKNLKYLLILLLFPFLVDAAKLRTLNDYQKKVDEYRAAINEANSKIAASTAQINNAKNRISFIKKEQKRLGEEITVNNEKVIEYRADIKEKREELKRLINYTSVAESSNFYLDYIFDSEDVTDFIYRSTVAEQVVDAYHIKSKQLEETVEKLQARQKEIDRLQVEMESSQKILEANIIVLGETKASYETAGISAAKQLKIYQDQVDAYKKMGCKPNDVIGVNCATVGSAGVFRRPTDRGRVTQNYGRTSFNPFHRGLDIARDSSGISPRIYPVGNGVITAMYRDSYGALCMAIEYNQNGVYYTSLYAHLASYAPGMYVGKRVDSNQYVGIMGNTGKSTGVHLHFELAQCRFMNPNDRRCSTWNGWTNFVRNNNQNPRRWINFPSLFSSYYGR